MKISASPGFCPGVHEPEAPASKHRKREASIPLVSDLEIGKNQNLFL